MRWNKLAFVLNHKNLTCSRAAWGWHGNAGDGSQEPVPVPRAPCPRRCAPPRCRCLALFPAHKPSLQRKVFCLWRLESANKQGGDLRSSFKAIPPPPNKLSPEIMGENYLEMKPSHLLQAPDGKLLGTWGHQLSAFFKLN